MKINYIFSFFIILILFSANSYSQGRIVIEGSVIDEYGMEVPFAAVGIIKKKYWSYFHRGRNIFILCFK